MKKLYALLILFFFGIMNLGTVYAQLPIKPYHLLHLSNIGLKHGDSIMFSQMKSHSFSLNVQPREKLVQKDTTINLSAGTLSTILTGSQKATITNLQLTGTIDARDFKTMRDSLPLLSIVDISNAIILSYTGTHGTSGANFTFYPANTIPQAAFKFFNNINTINFPNSITSIGDSAFYFCQKLKGLIIPNSVTSIGNYAFSFCNSLNSLILPDSIISIGNAAFYFCRSIGGILTLPSSLTFIGLEAFSLNSITGFIVEKNNPYFSVLDGVLFNKDQDRLILYPPHKQGSYTIPNTVISISSAAFEDCEDLTGTITLPNSVTTMGENAFGDCQSLNGVILSNSLTAISAGAFAGDWALSGNLIIPNSVTSIGKAAFYECYGLKSLTIPNSVTSIGDIAFYRCKSVTSIYAYYTIPLALPIIPNWHWYNVFWGVEPSICTLYVPYGTKTLYQAADQWNMFTNIVEMAPTGINELTDNEHFILYPNPFTEGFYIDAVVVPATVSIHNLSGIEVLSRQVKGKSYVNIAGVPSGQYIVQIITAEGIIEKKLIKK